MNNRALFSIITPSYNQGQFIQATIDSVLGQSYRNIEYFVIDGGSNDNTLEILQQYSDPRLTWISERDVGQSDAINKGLRRATGEYLTYLNSDDLLLPDSISFAVQYFEQHPQVDLLYGDGYYVDMQGKRLSAYRSTRFALAECLFDRQRLAQPGTFWRKQVTEAIGLFDEELHYRMDFDYWVRAALAGFHLEYVVGERAAYRLHDDSKTIAQVMAFPKDWDVIVRKVFSQRDLSPALLELKDDALEQADWSLTTTLWLDKRYREVRPKLRKFVRARKISRCLLAGTMLVDAYLDIRLTKSLVRIFNFVAKRDILSSQQLTH